MVLLLALFCIPGKGANERGLNPSTFSAGFKCQRVFREFSNAGGSVRESLAEYFSADDSFVDSIIVGHKVWVVSRGELHNRLIDFSQTYSLRPSLREIQIEGFDGDADRRQKLIEFNISEAFRWDLGEGCTGVKLDLGKKEVTVFWEQSQFNQLQSGWPKKIGPYDVKIEFVNSSK